MAEPLTDSELAEVRHKTRRIESLAALTRARLLATIEADRERLRIAEALLDEVEPLLTAGKWPTPAAAEDPRESLLRRLAER